MRVSDWDTDLDGTPAIRGWQARVDACGFGIDGSTCNGGTRDGECCVADSMCPAGGVCENPGAILTPAIQACTSDTDCDTNFAPGSACIGVCVGGADEGSDCSVDDDCTDGVCNNKTCDAGFIDSSRSDYLFFGIGSLVAGVVKTTLNYEFGGAAFFDAVADNGSEFYGGTLVLDVPLLAVGTYTVSIFPNEPAVTFLLDAAGNAITPVATIPVTIDIDCVSSANCDDGDECTDDSCNGNGTGSNVINYNPATECCDSSTGAITNIDDGNECTIDVCNPDGSVSHPFAPPTTSCGDPTNTACDNPDTCDGNGNCLPEFEPSGTACGNPADTECDDPDTCDGSGSCLPNFELVNTPCGDPGNTQCDDPDSCSGNGVCRENNEPNGFTCDDALFCNVNEACQNGVCTGGSARNCADALACTTDTCNEIADQCDHTLDPGFCLITGSCFGEGAIEPANDCMDCNTSISTSAWSPRSAGNTCNDGIFCTIDDACDGAGNCLADDRPDGTTCANDGNLCTADVCLTGACSHPFENPGFSCGSATGTDCNNPDSCDGAGNCLDNFELFGVDCGDPSETQCDLADICDGSGSCTDNPISGGTPCDDGDPLTAEDACDGSGNCGGTLIPEASLVEGIGPRALFVTPLPVDSPVPVALQLTSPDWPCLFKYVNLDGTLTSSPVTQTPAAWGTINVHDPEIVPDTTYVVIAEIGKILAPPGSAQTAKWGDVDLNGRAEIRDVLFTVDGFLGLFLVPEEAMDLLPCIPDERVNIRDVLAAVDAWLGVPYPCPVPCP